MKLSRITIGSFALTLLALAGCPVTADDLCAGAACEAVSPDATSPTPNDAGPDGIIVVPRDPCVDKPLAPECVTNEGALFVSKTADAAVADGTIAKPYASLATALAKVTGEKRRIYVCEGTYEEQVTIETVPSTVIGGLSCDFKNPGRKPKIAPKSGIAFGIAAVGGASVIDVTIEAVSDTNAPGSSAVGMFITGSTQIFLRGVEITTGPGQHGTNGANGSDTPNHPGGQAPQAVGGGGGGAAGIGPICPACADATKSVAGNGGATTPSFAFPSPGDAMPKVPGQVSNSGTSAPTVCTPGLPGANGGPGAKATGGTAPGKLAAKSWTDRSKTALAGKNGGPGQGGGGGGTLTSGGGGGSGACGGCGGTGGGAGTDGGSSIGILIHQSTKVVIEKSTVTTAAGGNGGNGGDGQVGQEAPLAGGVSGGGGACAGGAGGHGAGGGGGGGGIGGYSVPIAYAGEAPQTAQSVLTPSTAGMPGTGGKGGPAVSAGNKGEDGANGPASKAENVLNLDAL